MAAQGRRLCEAPEGQIPYMKRRMLARVTKSRRPRLDQERRLPHLPGEHRAVGAVSFSSNAEKELRCRSIRPKTRQSSQENRSSRRGKTRLEIRGRRFLRPCTSQASRARRMNCPAMCRMNCRRVGRKHHPRRPRRRISEAADAAFSNLVSRFRSSYHFRGATFTNFGIKRTLANLLFQCGFGSEVRMTNSRQ